jgi:O-antigen/teichoic acid export membrane protein
MIQAASQWLRLGAAARWADPISVGQYALASAVVGPVFQFVGLQLRTVVAASVGLQLRKGALYRIRAATGAIGIVLASVLCAMYRPWRVASPVIVAFAAARAAEGLLEVEQGMAERERRFARSAGVVVAKSLFGATAFVAVLVQTGGGIVGALWGATFAVLAVAVVVIGGFGTLRMVGSDGADRTTGGASPSTTDELRLAIGAAPLGVAMLLSTLNAAIPQLVTQFTLGGAEGGVYLLLTAPGIASVMIVSGMGQALVPVLGEHWLEGRRAEYLRELRRLAVVAILVCLGGIGAAVVAGSAVLRVLYGSGMGAHHHAFVLAMITAGVGCLAAVTGYGMTAMRAFRVQVPQLALTCLATLGGTSVGARIMGIQGVILGAGAGLLVQVLVGYSIVRAMPFAKASSFGCRPER